MIPHEKLTLDLTRMDRVFVVSDIHGCLDILLETLASVRFDVRHDVLIINGDLIDRGSQSLETLSWYSKANGEGWCYATLGNHEHMLIEAQDNWGEHSYIYLANGGVWFKDLQQADRQHCYDICKTLYSCIEVTLKNGKHMIVHAQYDKGFFVGNYNPENDSYEDYEEQLAHAVWARTSAKCAKNGYVLAQHTNPDYTSIVHGHTPNTSPVVCENLYFIDTGVVYGNGKYFKMLELNTLQFTRGR